MRTPFRTSIFSQMLALALVSSAVALLLNLLLQMLVPGRPLATHTVTEIADGVEHRADWLGMRVVSALPAAVRPAAALPAADDANPAAEVVAARLARRLRLPADDIRVLLSRAQGRRSVLLHSAAGQPELAVVGDFHLWVRRADGRYSEYTSGPQGFLDDRLRRNLLLFVVSALVMLPVAWAVARWLARPFKQFARVADQLGRDPGRAPPRIGGSTEADRASTALWQMQQRIDSYITDRTRMLAAIAHDLRTPLTRLAFRIEAVPAPLADDMARDVDEMQQMLRATMQFARADALAGPRVALDLSDLAAEVADDLALTAPGVVFHPAGCPLPVTGDRVALRRLLANLAGNALAYGGNAVIRARAEADSAIIEVDDNGPGIPDAELERLFEPFQRLERSRNRNTGGIGLGLPIARSTARAHGGDVVLLNRPEGGARARLTLPLATDTDLD